MGRRSVKREQRELAVRMRAEGNTWVEISDVIRTRYGVSARAAIRLAHGWSQDRVAHEWCARWPDEPKAAKNISTWETWPHSGHAPSLDTLERLAQIYGCDIGDLLVDLPGYRDRDEAHIASCEMSHFDVVDRRQLLRGGLAAGTAAMLPSGVRSSGIVDRAAEESAALVDWAATSTVTDDTVAELDRHLRALARAYVTGRPLPLMVQTRRLRDRVVHLLQSHHGWRHTRDLWLLAARASTLLAWATGDLGNYTAAAQHGSAAWICAQNADHDGARTWVRATQAKLAYWAGDHAESCRLATDGLTYKPSDSAGVLLSLLDARAWARLGRTDRSGRALERWHRERERTPGPDEVGGVLGLSAAQQHYLAGTTYLWLHEPVRAVDEADQALALFEASDADQRFYGAEMLCRVDAARAHVRQREIDGAVEVIQPVLALDPAQRLDTFCQNLGLFRRELPTRRSPIAADLATRIDDYCTVAAGRDAQLA